MTVQQAREGGFLVEHDGRVIHVPDDPANRHYQALVAPALARGEVLPAPELPEASPRDRLDVRAALVAIADLLVERSSVGLQDLPSDLAAAVAERRRP